MRKSPRVVLSGFGVAALSALAAVAPARAALILDLTNPLPTLASSAAVQTYGLVGTVYNTGPQPVTLNQINYSAVIYDAAGDPLEVDPVGLNATVAVGGSYTGTLLVYTLAARQPVGTYAQAGVGGGPLPTVTVDGFAPAAPTAQLASNATPYAAIVTAAVPEPASAALLAAAGVVALRRRRSASAM